ncbi:MAG: hypothetical protein WCW40_05415 [Bacteroidota bacterium]
MRYWNAFGLVLLLCSAAFSQERYYFYTGKSYGSESMINPGSLVVNAGFDILQSATHSRIFSTIKFGSGAKNLVNNLADPFTQINKFGWGEFIGQEVFPTSLKIEKAQWFPNYTLHFIGGGFDGRMMAEWYRYHNFPYPSLFAGLTVATYHFVNEAVENDTYQGPNVDPIADIYIFNLGGALLFSSDAVAEFFSETLHMTAWPGQPAWNSVYNTLENHGQYYVMKYRLPFAPTTSLFYHFGDNGLVGLSFLGKNNESFTVAAGATQKALRNVNPINAARVVTVELGWMAGVFYDRDNSLLASVLASSRINEKLRLNLYPGFVDLWGFTPGFFAAVGSRNQFIAGITMQYSPLGLAYRNKL